MKKYILLITFFTLLSCGARKSQVNKSEAEKYETTETITDTKEQISELVTKEIDTTVSIPGKMFEGQKPIQHVIDGEPLIYENEDIKSETYYDTNTGDLKNKTTIKPKDIPVKQKEITERQINRDISQSNKTEAKEKIKTKIKATDREASYNWIWWIVIGIALFWLIIFIIRKIKERSMLK